MLSRKLYFSGNDSYLLGDSNFFNSSLASLVFPLVGLVIVPDSSSVSPSPITPTRTLVLIASLLELAFFRRPSPQLLARFTNALPALVLAPMSIPPLILVLVVGNALVDKVRFRLRLRSTLDMPSEADPSGDGVSRALDARVGGDIDSSGAAGGDGDITSGRPLLE